MHLAVYLPLVVPVFAAVSARWLAARLDPRVATWLLTVAAVALAAASGAALAVLTATALGQIPWLADAGDWSVTALRRDSPTSVYLALAAGLVLTVAVAAAVRLVHGRVAAMLAAARTADCLPGAGQTVVLDDPVPDAYALPGRPGRVVVSTGMLDALDEREQRVLMAHERAHLACRHHLFVALADLAAAANPLLRPVAAAVRYSTERWADERAAVAVGDRTVAARTVARAALLTSGRRHRSAAALAVADPGASPAGLLRGRRVGPVPLRVAALLCPPVGRRPLLWGVIVVGVLLTAAATGEAAHDLHTLFEHARAAS